MSKIRVVEPSRLKEIRKQLGMTQQEMANLLYVSMRHYQSWEHGDYSMPLAKYELLCLKKNMADKGSI